MAPRLNLFTQQHIVLTRRQVPIVLVLKEHCHPKMTISKRVCDRCWLRLDLVLHPSHDADAQKHVQEKGN